MKVIRMSGGGWSTQVQCTGKGNGNGNAKAKVYPCGATLEIETKDIFTTTSYCGWDNSSTEYNTFKCGVCGSLTDVYKLPSEIEQYARYNKKQVAGKPEKPLAMATESANISNDKLKQVKVLINGLTAQQKLELGLTRWE